MRWRWPSNRARWLASLALMAAVATCYAAWPRRADLRRFDAAAMGRAEAVMWRQYYERRYLGLLRSLYRLNRCEYGFSPWDSARLAYYAAKAAAAFQPTRSRAEAQVALPTLTRYFSLLTRRAGGRADAARVARLELGWWQQRRENVSPREYGVVIAQVEAELYGVPEHALRSSALLRAEMMAYRDARRDGQMRANDWSHLEQQLSLSYQWLKAAVGE